MIRVKQKILEVVTMVVVETTGILEVRIDNNNQIEDSEKQLFW